MSKNLGDQAQTRTERRSLRRFFDHLPEKEGSLTEKLIMLFALLTALMIGAVIYGWVHKTLR